MAQPTHTIDRRTLIKGGTLAATALAAGAPLGASAEEPSSVDAVSIPKIDVHAHVLPACYLEGLAAQGLAPEDEDGFSTPAWDEDAHLGFMDDTGIDYAVLSLSTPHIHRGDDEKALALAVEVNDATKAICDRHPDRFGFAACLPLPYVEGSIAETRRAFEDLGALGVKVPSNACGVYLGDPSLDPIMEVLQEYGAVVTIHPSRAQEVPAGAFTSGPAPLFEYFVDTTRAVYNLCANGTLDRYPDVKFVVPHCGSFIPPIVHRLMGMSKVLVPAGMMQEIDITECMKKLYFDIAGACEPVMLPALMEIADPTHLLYGSDYPYSPAPFIGSVAQQVASDPTLDEKTLMGIFAGNARALYGLA